MRPAMEDDFYTRRGKPRIWEFLFKKGFFIDRSPVSPYNREVRRDAPCSAGEISNGMSAPGRPAPPQARGRKLDFQPQKPNIMYGEVA
jgi:hypothetical protein